MLRNAIESERVYRSAVSSIQIGVVRHRHALIRTGRISKPVAMYASGLLSRKTYESVSLIRVQLDGGNEAKIFPVERV